MKHYLTIFKKIFYCLLFSYCSAVFAEPPTPAMLKVMQQPRYSNAQWWMLVKDLDTGKILYELNSDHLLMPASTTKLFSTATALNTLGDDYRFKTPVYFIGKQSGSTLTGKLILVGKGDLEFGSRVKDDKLLVGTIDHIYANVLPGASIIPINPLSGLNSLAQQIAAKGIKRIDGEVLVDNSYFHTETLRSYIISPIMINENLMDFQIKPAALGNKANIQWRPQAPGYTVINEVKTVAKGQAASIQITTNKDNTTYTITGKIAVDSPEILRTHAIMDPAKFAQSAFIAALKQAGIEVKPNPQAHSLTNTSYSKLTPVAEYVSPPYSEYVKVILKLSHNIGADMIPLLLAAKHGATQFDDGMPYIADYLINRVGIQRNEFVFGDGAGGDSNRLLPNAAIQLLTFMHQQPKNTYQKYFDALPVLGIDGSLATAAKNVPAVGKINAKTGTSISYDFANKRFNSFSEVLAGYIAAQNGHTLAFITAVSNTPMDSINDAFIIQQDVSAVASEIYNAVK